MTPFEVFCLVTGPPMLWVLVLAAKDIFTDDDTNN